VLAGHFHVLVLVIAPTFPACYAEFIVKTCRGLIVKVRADLNFTEADDLGLGQLYEAIQVYQNGSQTMARLPGRSKSAIAV